MSSTFDCVRRALLAGALVFPSVYMPNAALALAEPAQVAITTVADFDASTWKSLLRSGPRPAAYVFTNSFCATCPEAFVTLHQTVTAYGKRVDTAAILMDVQGQRALAHAHHYTGVTKIYAFNGFEPAIRQAVDPKWRNITPYVVLVGKDGKLQRVTGQPDARQLKAWLL
ncbi:MAG: hypothetical protein V4858_05885 [Pseudomonadota bacterium]